jgi:nicotinamidase-related amidase
MTRVRRFLVCAVVLCAASQAASVPGAALKLNLRTRVEAFKGSGDWQEAHFEKTLPVARTAIVICDMWDKHWCSGASRRVDALAERMAPVVSAARASGILIIHAPSETMEFYKDSPQRQRMLAVAKVPVPQPLPLTDPPLPIDDSDGGCDTPDKFYKAWTREIATLHVAPEDAISDNGAEIYSLLRARGIENLLVMGVHTNMCILNRTFAIKQMTKWGVRCVLVRDLTDSMYNPKDRPFVAHDRGTALVIEHIEKYWAPTVLSADLIAALPQAK